MRTVTCMCEAVFEADLPEEIDLDASPAALDEILSGDFFKATCPTCGAELKPELRVRLVSRKGGIDLVALPELDRSSLYLGSAGIPAGAEALVGFPELFERARILKDGLDPEAVEILKLWLLEKAGEQSPEAEVSVAYSGKKDGRLQFHLSGIRKDEIAVLPVDQATYDKALAGKARSKQEAPFDRVFRGPYRSIRVLELDEEA